jgi:hypothetical protein
VLNADDAAEALGVCAYQVRVEVSFDLLGEKVSSSPVPEAMDTSAAPQESAVGEQECELFPGFHFDLDRPTYSSVASTDTSLLHSLSTELKQ